MRKLNLALGALTLALAVEAMAVKARPAVVHKGNFGLAGWLVYWDPKSMQSFEKNAAIIDRVYPEWYHVSAEGLPADNLAHYKTPEEQAAFKAAKKKTVEIARKHGVQIFSMVINYDNAKATHSAALVQKFLKDKALTRKHIALLVKNALDDGAAGIDIDYENLVKADAAPLVQFMAQLRKACDKHGLLVAQAVAPKVSDAGTWDGNQAHDYPGLGPSVDLLRPMTYDEHWATADAGPVSSPSFTESVDKYAASVLGGGKVELGIAGYGYDWLGKQGRTITWDDLQALKKKGVKITRDPVTQELTGKYAEKGQTREFWFCDSVSYRPKYEIIRKYKLAGLAMWRFGSEDPAFWDDVKTYKFAKTW